MTHAAQAGKLSNKTDWHGLLLVYFFFWYFSGVHHLLLQVIDAISFASFRLATVASTLWLIPVLLAPKYTRQIAALIGIVLWVFSLVSLGYFFIYQNEFSQSVLFIIFESNPAEASEYVAQYFVWWMIPAFVIYSLAAWLIWRKLRPVAISPKRAWFVIAIVVTTLFAYPQFKNLRGGVISSAVAADAIIKRIEPAVPWQILVGYSEYRQQLAAVEELVAKNHDIPPLKNLIDRNGSTPTTLVLVIGESTNRQHMSLYGYHRQPTPRLDALSKELTVFDNVVASRPYTIETLQQALTFADQENPDLYLSTPSLMNIMKQAGYRTYWITNQQTMTQRNTMLTNFSKQTDEQVYLNNTRVQNSRAYDGAVLDPFGKILADGVEKRFIIVHLLGTHMRYEFRYPPEDEYFKGRDGLPEWADEEQTQFINEYDNAVRYNDFVVGSLIEQLRTAKKPVALFRRSRRGCVRYAPAQIHWPRRSQADTGNVHRALRSLAIRIMAHSPSTAVCRNHPPTVPDVTPDSHLGGTGRVIVRRSGPDQECDQHQISRAPVASWRPIRPQRADRPAPDAQAIRKARQVAAGCRGIVCAHPRQ